jgi:hypothetical protein
MFSAYFDESYSPGTLPGICVAGVYYDDKARKRLNKQWKGVLERSGIRYFHTVEQAHLRREFAAKTRKQSDAVYQELLAVLRTNALGSVAICHIPDVYAIKHGELNARHPLDCPYSPYSICSYICMSMILLTAKSMRQKKVNFFVEAGADKMNELQALTKRQRVEEQAWSTMVASCGFIEKRDAAAIQTADVLAYEYWKRVCDLAKTRDGTIGRDMRKSLESVIVISTKRDNHRFAVLGEYLMRRALSILRGDLRIPWQMVKDRC